MLACGARHISFMLSAALPSFLCSVVVMLLSGVRRCALGVAVLCLLVFVMYLLHVQLCVASLSGSLS